MVMPNKSVVGVVISIVALMTLPIIPSVAEQTTEYRDTQIKPVETDDVQRKQWSLSTAEWSRYQTLMKRHTRQHQSGQYLADLSPRNPC